MVALTTDRSTPLRQRDEVESHPVKGGVKIFAGSLVCLTAAGWAAPGATALGLKPLGRAEVRLDATNAADGDLRVRVRRGALRFANSAAADAITRADIGNKAFVVDDQTVAKTDSGGTRTGAGIIRDVDAQGVWVEF